MITMTSNTTVIIVQNNHTHATEFLIILSQTVFFVLLFTLLKSALIDRRGMMHSYNRIQEEKLQLIAIYFAIFVFIALIMVPLESYENVHYVIPLVYFTITGMVIWEVHSVYKNRDSHTAFPRRTFNNPACENPVSLVVKDPESPVGFVVGNVKATFDY